MKKPKLLIELEKDGYLIDRMLMKGFDSTQVHKFMISHNLGHILIGNTDWNDMYQRKINAHIELNHTK